MKKLSILFGSMLLTGIASAAPFVAYSGQAKWTASQSGRMSARTIDIYLVTDLANPASYGVLQYDDSTRQGEIDVFPLTSPTELESGIDYFLESNGTASLSIGETTTSASDETDFTQCYATGHLITTNTVLAAKRNGETSFFSSSGGIVIFLPTQAVTSGSHPYAPQFTGASASYTIPSTGSVTETGGLGTFALALNSSLTAAANVGGGFAAVTPGPTFVNAQTVMALEPVIPLHQSPPAAQAYTQWLTSLASILHVKLTPSSTGSTTPNTNGGNLGGSSGASTSAGGVSLSTGGGGTLMLTGGTTYSGGTTLGGGSVIVAGAGSGTLKLDGSITNGGGSGSGTLTLGNGSGGTTTTTGSLTLTSGGTGTFTISTGGTIGTGSTLTGNLIINFGTVSITSINGNLVSGTIVTAAPNSITFDFSNMALVLNGTANPAGVMAGDSYVASATLSGGSITPATVAPPDPATFSSGTLSITTP